MYQLDVNHVHLQRIDHSCCLILLLKHQFRTVDALYLLHYVHVIFIKVIVFVISKCRSHGWILLVSSKLLSSNSAYLLFRTFLSKRLMWNNLKMKMHVMARWLWLKLCWFSSAKLDFQCQTWWSWFMMNMLCCRFHQAFNISLLYNFSTDLCQLLPGLSIGFWHQLLSVNLFLC